MAQKTERYHLTTGKVENLPTPVGKDTMIYDDDPRQLAVRVTPAGEKSYRFCSKLKGVSIRITIGSTNVWTLDAARKKARNLQTLVDEETDPRDLIRNAAEAKDQAQREKEAEKQRAMDRAQYTLAALCEKYARWLETREKKSPKSAAAARSCFACWIPATIGKKPANEVTSEEIAALIRRPADAGHSRTAGILRSYLHAAFRAAEVAPFSPALPADLIGFQININPVAKIPSIAVNTHNRTLSETELGDYMRAMGDSLPHQVLLIALLAGGQRYQQLIRCTVTDWDTATHTLKLLDGKGRRAQPRIHLLPLAPRAAGMVAALVERARDNNTPWIFSATGRGPLDGGTPGKVAKKIFSALGCPELDLKVIRRTCETRQAAIGISKDTRAQIFSHGISGVQSAHYDRHDYATEKRAALIAWERYLLRLETGQTQDNVIQLHAA